MVVKTFAVVVVGSPKRLAMAVAVTGTVVIAVAVVTVMRDIFVVTT